MFHLSNIFKLGRALASLMEQVYLCILLISQWNTKINMVKELGIKPDFIQTLEQHLPHNHGLSSRYLTTMRHFLCFWLWGSSSPFTRFSSSWHVLTFFYKFVMVWQCPCRLTKRIYGTFYEPLVFFTVHIGRVRYVRVTIQILLLVLVLFSVSYLLEV